MRNQKQPAATGVPVTPPPQFGSGGVLAIICMVLAAFVLISIAAFRDENMLPRGLYAYDEADYLFAAKTGIAANYLDRGAISIFSFIAAGLKSGFDKTKWSALSLSIRSSDDVTFYRHFHGPLYFYWLACAQKCGIDTEAHMRYATFLFMLFIAAALAFFIYRLFPGHFALTALPLLAALMTGPSIILTVNHITPHALYLFLSLVCLGFLSLFCASGQRRYWYWSVIFASLAFMTLEYALFLVISLFAALFFFRKDIFGAANGKERLRFTIASCASFLLPLLLLWPSGIFKLTIAKNYLYYLYFTFVRGGYYSDLSPAQVWWMRLQESPAEYLLVAASLAALPLVLKKFRFLLPLSLYGVLVLMTTARNNSTFPQYISSVFPAFYLVAAAVLHIIVRGRTPAIRIAPVVVLVAMTLFSSARYFSAKAAISLQRLPFQITSLADLKPLATDRDTPLFLNKDYIPVLHYYFPDSRLYPFNPKIENLTVVLKKIAAVLEQGYGSAMLILDDKNSSPPASAEHQFTIRRRGNLFISGLAPAATSWDISLRVQEP